MKNTLIYKLVMVTIVVATNTPVYAETLTVEQVLQRVVNHYPSIKTASIQVEKAKQESIKIDSQLGWQLGAQAGISRNVFFLWYRFRQTGCKRNVITSIKVWFHIKP